MVLTRIDKAIYRHNLIPTTSINNLIKEIIYTCAMIANKAEPFQGGEFILKYFEQFDKLDKLDEDCN